MIFDSLSRPMSAATTYLEYFSCKKAGENEPLKQDFGTAKPTSDGALLRQILLTLHANVVAVLGLLGSERIWCRTFLAVDYRSLLRYRKCQLRGKDPTDMTV